jgi:hypothetical protein
MRLAAAAQPSGACLSYCSNLAISFQLRACLARLELRSRLQYRQTAFKAALLVLPAHASLASLPLFCFA